MPIKKRQVSFRRNSKPSVRVKRETKDRKADLSALRGVAEVKNSRKRIDGRLKATESSADGTAKHIADTSLVGILCDDQSRREKLPKTYKDLSERSFGDGQVTALYVPVVSADDKALMPCHPARARELIRKNKAVRRFKSGIFYIKLLDRKSGKKQKVSCGIDPGSKREAFTIKSANRTYLNVLSDAVDWVKDAIKTRREMRRSRRNRKTPCRQPRWNRKSLKKNFRIPPSTKARWQAKLRIINILSALYPIAIYVVEDIKAITKKGKKMKRYNRSFSPLEQGKTLFYDAIKKNSKLILKQGYETAEERDNLFLIKNYNKLSETFETHNVDSWVLANFAFNREQTHLDNKRILRMIPLRFHRRQLHSLQPAKNGFRRNYGGTISLGFKRGSLVKTAKYGTCYVGGNSNNRISVHDIKTGERLSRSIKLENAEFLTYNYWRVHFLPGLKAGVPMHRE